MEAAYEAVGAGDFTRACELVTPEAKTAFGMFGGTCETAFAEEYPSDVRLHFIDVQVDEDALEVSSDVAVVPESAVTFDGEPSTDGDTTVVKRDGKWWITL